MSKLHVRISPEHLEKLRELAKKDSRSMTNLLETMIDQDYKTLEAEKMLNILKQLKGKNIEEGKRILSKLNIECNNSAKDEQAGLMDFYFKLNEIDWFCFTARYEEVQGDEEKIDYSNGYWQLSLDNEIYSTKDGFSKADI